MNKERILAVADAIENATLAKERGIGFNMVSYITDDVNPEEYLDKTGYKCNTVACIAGWACLMFDPDNHIINKWAALKILNITSEEADNLFAPNVDGSYLDISDKHAINVLRHFAETGVIDWDITKPK